MPLLSSFSRSATSYDASIVSIIVLEQGLHAPLGPRHVKPRCRCSTPFPRAELELSLCTDPSQASTYTSSQQFVPVYRGQRRYLASRLRRYVSGSDAGLESTKEVARKKIIQNDSSLIKQAASSTSGSGDAKNAQIDVAVKQADSILHAFQGLVDTQDDRARSDMAKQQAASGGRKEPFAIAGSRLPVEFFTDLNNLKRTHFSRNDYQMTPWVLKKAPRPRAENLQDTNHGKALSQFFSQRRSLHSTAAKFDSKRERFARGSHLPLDFFEDVSALDSRTSPRRKSSTRFNTFLGDRESHVVQRSAKDRDGSDSMVQGSSSSVTERMALLQSVRELEEKLSKAKKELSNSMATSDPEDKLDTTGAVQPTEDRVVLTKEDYINLVDLYYYSHNSRFSPESTDSSPTPLLLDDYSFTLSSDFSLTDGQSAPLNEDEDYESPLKQIEEMLKRRQLREVAAMQVFVDLLLDDHSSNRALFEAYQELPDPGVAYLPKGVLRVFMQRMSVPWTVSETSMLRYLSLIDAMQKARIPITVAEWSSAIYLAGRAFSRVTSEEMTNAFQIWQSMEREAGVQASNVTFNILFDIAVRAGRFALGETILKEMHSRNLRLNRLGRVSLIYYHGLRRDGDGVRKAYRDFVEAGEIVDTLVLNCVMASLLNAQEPQAAEQVYARMKSLQSHIRENKIREKGDTMYQRYPDPGVNTIDQEMASNHLGRILEKAPRLQQVLPENHKQLQSAMPLTPDQITFRTLIKYHVDTSGDLDRLAVLLNEMTHFFQLPLQTITFQLLFKGFAVHGPKGGPDSAWSVKRLDLCWNAYRAAFRASRSKFSFDSSEAEGSAEGDFGLPSITQLNAGSHTDSSLSFQANPSQTAPRRLSNWAEFVLDLTSFSTDKLRQLRRFHASIADAKDTKTSHDTSQSRTFRSPFFQPATVHSSHEQRATADEDAYTLPNPSESGLVRHAHAVVDTDEDLALRESKADADVGAPHQVRTNKMLVCWLLRAYARTTRSRLRVEEVWGGVRKMYKPRDDQERAELLKVFTRCLKDCDLEGGR